MSENEKGAFEITKDAFGSLEALVKDARGNAILAGDRNRLHIGAGYLRLAAQKSAALSDLIDAVANQERTPGRKAIKRLAQIDREIEKYLDKVAIDNERWAKESGAVRMTISGEDFQQLLKGEQPPELISKFEQARKEKESA